MDQIQKSVTSSEVDLLKRVKEELQIEMVSSSGLSSLRMQFLHDTIGLLNFTLMDKDDEPAPETI